MVAPSHCARGERRGRFLRLVTLLVLLVTGLAFPAAAQQQEGSQLQSIDEELEALRSKLVELNSDLDSLEQDLLAPRNSAVKVFLTSSAGKKFQLQAVKVLVDDRMVGTHVYRPEENLALQNGGAQTLFEGPIPVGDHTLIAQFSGVDLVQSRLNKSIKIKFKGKEKTLTFVELRVDFSSSTKQPEFKFEIYE